MKPHKLGDKGWTLEMLKYGFTPRVNHSVYRFTTPYGLVFDLTFLNGVFAVNVMSECCHAYLAEDSRCTDCIHVRSRFAHEDLPQRCTWKPGQALPKNLAAALTYLNLLEATFEESTLLWVMETLYSENHLWQDSVWPPAFTQAKKFRRVAGEALS